MSDITGKLLVKNPEQTFGSNGFRKREFVIETESQYPQRIIIELIQDKCSLIDSFNLGDLLKVSYNLNGREWINPQGVAKYFNSVQGWRIESLNVNDMPVNDAQEVAPDLSANEPDGLPF